MKWFPLNIFIVITFFFSIPISAQEEIQTKYFGVGATVEEIDQAIFSVKTNGKKVGEGFVFTTEQISSGEDIKFQISLQGNNTIYIKLVETDAKGTFVKEQNSPAILLEDNWKEFVYKAKLDNKTKQIDIFVVTDAVEQIEFKFRDAIMN